MSHPNEKVLRDAYAEFSRGTSTATFGTEYPEDLHLFDEAWA